MDDDTLDHRLLALKRELATLRPPLEVVRGLDAAIVEAERASRTSRTSSTKPRRLGWTAGQRWLAWPVALAAALGLITWTSRTPPPDETAVPRVAAAHIATDFIPVVPVTDIARTRGAYVVSTQVPRTMLADFGFPVSPARAAEPVAGELLVRGDGTVLAVRFLE
jgi:ribosomal protein L24E